jgi:drug/metabolite transporter (DMT)-like permease
MIIFLLRRLSPRGRRFVGLGLVAAGLVLIAVSATLVPGLLVHGFVLAAVGAAVVAFSIVSGRRSNGIVGDTEFEVAVLRERAD